jgi:hypothetical protein
MGALLTVVIWSAWPACTRLSLATTLSAPDLVALRQGIGGALLLPVLIHGARLIAARLARGTGRSAMLVTLGLRYAPAGHMAALSPTALSGHIGSPGDPI